MLLEVKNLDYQTLNQKIRQAEEDKEICLTGCCGQRFLAAGMKDKTITIHGIPGNALGAYLDGASIEVYANAQDAVGDTMNDGSILIHGSIGDAAGYAMRGGKIFIQKDAGYRAGIHMKAYQDKIPVMVIGGRAGSFLGEYQAGGIIVVLGLDQDGSGEDRFSGCAEAPRKPIVGNFPCTGMHGGTLYLRGSAEGIRFPKNVCVREAEPADLDAIQDILDEFCGHFGYDAAAIRNSRFTVITPDSKNPYKQMYVAN
ncbi:MAG: glutamate synthase [Lachnospiraceae bacterium]|nr:glutamate synthase [Lachnospiraceae bacterium]